MFDIKKSGNPKIYIEMLLIKYIKEILGEKIISQEIIKKPVSNEKSVGNNSKVEISSNNNEILLENTVSNICFNKEYTEDESEEDEEYDFDKEFSDDSDGYEEMMGNNYQDVISEDDISNGDISDDDSSSKIIKNIDDMIERKNIIISY